MIFFFFFFFFLCARYFWSSSSQYVRVPAIDKREHPKNKRSIRSFGNHSDSEKKKIYSFPTMKCRRVVYMYISLTRFQSRFRCAPTISCVLEYCADKEKRHSAEFDWSFLTNPMQLIKIGGIIDPYCRSGYTKKINFI